MKIFSTAVTAKWQAQTTLVLFKHYGGLLSDPGVGKWPRILTDASGLLLQALIETKSLPDWEIHQRDYYQQV